MDLGNWQEYVIYGVVYFLLGIIGLHFVPIYCWYSLFFSIPLAIVESVYALYFIKDFGFDFTSATKLNFLFYLWICVGLIISIPFAQFMAIFGEIILIPSFFIGIPINIVASITLYIILLYYALLSFGTIYG